MKLRPLLVTSAALFCASASSFAQSTWNQTAAGPFSWNDPANWTPETVPNAVGATANLNNNISANTTVTLDAAITVGTLNIGDTLNTGNFTFTVNSGTSGNLTFDASSGNAQLNKTTGAGTDLINAAVTLNDNLSANITVGGVTFNSTITDGASTLGITKAGSGSISLFGANSFDGGLTINAGQVVINNTTGAGTGKIVLDGGANTVTLRTANNVTIANEVEVVSTGSTTRIGLQSGGVANISGALRLGAASSNNTINLMVSANSLVGSSTLSGDIIKVTSGTANITTYNGGAPTIGAIFSGNVTGSSVNLLLSNASGGGFTQVGAAGKTQEWGQLTHFAGGVIQMNGNASFTNITGGNATSIIRGANAGTTSFLTISGSTNSTFAGVIGTAGNATHNNVALIKGGSSTLILSANNTYTGTTAVNAGTLLINGSSASSAISVAASATLGGNATISGSVSVTGTLSPGNSPGILAVNNNITINDGGAVSFEVNGLTAGTQYDQVVMTGASSQFSLTGTNNLVLSVGFTPTFGDLFFLVDNQSTNAISGVFEQLNGIATTLNQGSIFTFGGQDYQISYTADVTGNSFLGGNDIALQAVPEPGTWALVGLGLGAVLLARRRHARQ